MNESYFMVLLVLCSIVLFSTIGIAVLGLMWTWIKIKLNEIKEGIGQMTIQEIVANIKNIKKNYVNGNINTDDMIECFDDLCCEIEESTGVLGGVFDMEGDDNYMEFEKQPDYTDLEII